MQTSLVTRFPDRRKQTNLVTQGEIRNLQNKPFSHERIKILILSPLIDMLFRVLYQLIAGILCGWIRLH